MNINRKYIIIFGTLVLLLVIIIGGITYYKKNKQKSDQPLTDKMMEIAESVSESCISSELENPYRVCCAIEGGIKKGFLYDCSSQRYFEPKQHIYIVFDASRFDISYDPYFLRLYSDLNYEGNKFILYETDTLDRKEIFLMKVLGTVPQETESFILLKASVYPNNEFDGKDEQVILYREAKIFKE